ncbi:MAG: neutral/alkaline non-lysosomal ceramidase N-terminal domain-containing protein [Blastocatellales bacterium]|nr:neutral/alkaline non-lysosomal ceramidase N-terminal domain-containing protein [Blastocatellales bacterium]
MPRWLIIAVAALLIWPIAALVRSRLETLPTANAQSSLRVGASAIAVTPFGEHPDWDGQITDSGVWGERFTDINGNRVWDEGEPFEDDPGNTEIDPSSKGKYDGIYLAGFGNKRLASGRRDDYWVRTIVLDDGRKRIAVVALDFLGYYSEASFYGLNHVRKLVDPKLRIGEILIASTHNHEGPDTVGAWGNGTLSDGKYPKYLRFVDRQIARSIAEAAARLQPARLKLGRTDPQRSPSIARMQTRTSGRPPDFYDEELRVMQFVSAAGRERGITIATIINWNTHPESMEDKNTLMTSDFPHAVRESVEKKYGGVSLYISGAIGAVEIIGDTNNKASDRTRFDGREFPLNPKNNRPDFTFERTDAIGRDIAKAAFDALDSAESSTVKSIDIRKADLKAPMDNAGYMLLTRAGVLDSLLPDKDAPSLKTWIYALTLGDAQIVTTPGELFPELYFGVAKHGRSDCPEAHTGAPPEPSIRDAMTRKYRFVFGLCPDEFGYIVPKSDWRREPVDPEKMQIRQSIDPCREKGVPNHYHETNSASSELAPASACVTVALLTGRIPEDEACRDIARYSDYAGRLAAAKQKAK